MLERAGYDVLYREFDGPPDYTGAGAFAGYGIDRGHISRGSSIRDV